jgi:predicted phosphoribosyltransferase
VRQIHAEIVEPHQLAVDDPVRLAEIYLCVPRLVAQGMNTSRLRAACHIIADNGDATGETMLIAQTLENAGGSVSLLAVHLRSSTRIWSMISVYSASLRL